MPDIILHMAPGTCARVPSILLEHAGVDFETRVVRFMSGEHKRPPFTNLNPLGKVPVLQIDGHVLTENVAIITYLHGRLPQARLLPRATTAIEQAHQLADLSFCASTLHPLVTRIRLPQFIAGTGDARAVWDVACAAMHDLFRHVEARLDPGPWWYGTDWSAMDAYLYWIFWRVAGAGFPMEAYARCREHLLRMESLPAVQRALAREAEAQAILAAEGLVFTPPPVKSA